MQVETAAAHVGKRALVMSYSDCTHYLIGLTADPEGQIEHVDLLRDDAGQPLRYRNASRAQLALQGMGYENVWMLMHSAYDEMIGNEKAGPAELKLPPLALE